MKNILIIGLTLGVLISSSSKEKEQVSPAQKDPIAAKPVTAINAVMSTSNGKKAIDRQEKNCIDEFIKKCYGIAPLVFLPGEITEPSDISRFCASHPITCKPSECSARLNVLFNYVMPGKNGNLCLPSYLRKKSSN